MAKKCPICEADTEPPLRQNILEEWNCKRCGRFIIDYTQTVIGVPVDIKDKLATYLRRGKRESPVLVSEELFAEVRRLPESTITEKGIMLLQCIQERTGHFGEVVKLNTKNDFPLASAKNEREFRALLRLQHERGNLSEPHFAGDEAAVALSANGYETLDALNRSGKNSDKAFVAMWFDESMRPIYDDEIAPSIEDAGYRPIRIDLEDHNEDIVARVLMEIRESRFLIADFTGNRNGVYFEAGFAMGLGIDVVWLRRDDKGTDKEPHFDTEHFNHLVWTEGVSFRKRLHSRIIATIGPGPRIRRV